MNRVSKNKLILIILTLIGALLHFYNLNWGAPFYFHPDERNIASSVSQLQFPHQMNPHFFAYGSLPIYAIYFTGLFVAKFQTMTVGFDLAIQISRAYSALFATTLIPILFFLGKKIKNETAGLIAAFLATTSVGFIQFAHFGTFEMWLTFFSVLLFWVCLQKLSKKNLLLMGSVFGILVATKISSLILLPILLIVITMKAGIQKLRSKFGLTVLNILISLFLLLIVSFLIYISTNPFVFIDTKSFSDSMRYESGLALGNFPVFYTGEFFNTLPILFQFFNIYPFLLNPFITILFIPSFLYLSFVGILTKNKSYIILSTFYLILFLSQAFLFAKWTRYMVPTLPFVFLTIAISITYFLKNKKQQFNNVAMVTIIIISSIFAFSYFITAFVRPDTRVEAYNMSKKIIPFDAPILSEVYDLGIVPFNDSYTNIALFNFYELDNFSPDANPTTLQQQLEQRNYIILPSQRIIKTRLANDEQFPYGNTFYTNLIKGNLGYQKIYETPCDIFCKITYLGNPVFRFEETANVFDRPTVFIFKKQ